MEGTSIALVCMNRPHILSQTITNLETTLVHPYEVIVVDNGSTDELTLQTLTRIERDLGWTVIRNDANRGLSVATNQGLEAGQYDTLIHLDDDCIVPYIGWNQVLRRYLVECPEVGMVVPTQSVESIRHDRYQELRWALGMIWALRKSLFDDIGGYDPQLYHQNECDMALRVRMSGHRLAGIAEFHAIHNDPTTARSDISLAREHIGVVQFRDKWCSYFRGRDWNYGTQPVYLMQHWPPDQEFYRRYAVQEGLNLNPVPPEVVGVNETIPWEHLDDLSAQQHVHIQGTRYLIYRELRNDYAHWEWQFNPDGFATDRQRAIDRWFELTGEHYDGYKWPDDLLRPR